MLKQEIIKLNNKIQKEILDLVKKTGTIYEGSKLVSLSYKGEVIFLTQGDKVLNFVAKRTGIYYKISLLESFVGATKEQKDLGVIIYDNNLNFVNIESNKYNADIGILSNMVQLDKEFIHKILLNLNRNNSKYIIEISQKLSSLINNFIKIKKLNTKKSDKILEVVKNSQKKVETNVTNINTKKSDKILEVVKNSQKKVETNVNDNKFIIIYCDVNNSLQDCIDKINLLLNKGYRLNNVVSVGTQILHYLIKQ